MPQFSKGDTFADGQQVTGVRLNGLVDNATALPGLITDQTNLTANTVDSGDSVLLHDLSAGALREATAGDLLNSNLPITTSSVSGVSGSDITVTPAAGQKLDVDGSFEANSSNIVGNSTVGGSLTVTGASTLTGNVIADNGFTSNGVANFTGTLQVGGTVGYVLTQIVEENISYSGTLNSGAWTTCFTSASYTKPADEIWVIEADYRFRTNVVIYHAIRLQQTSSSTTLAGTFNIEGAGSDYYHVENGLLRSVIQSATTFTSTFTLEAQPSSSGYVFTIGETTFPYAPTYFNGITLPVSKFRIYKYKTA